MSPIATLEVKVSDVWAIVTFIGGILWFVFRVVFQKHYQRLTVDVTARRIKQGNEASLLVVECKISNKAEARIDFDSVTFRLSEPDNTGSDLTQDLPFNPNIKRVAASSPTPTGGHHPDNDLNMLSDIVVKWAWKVREFSRFFVEPARYSVDEQSSVRLCKLFGLDRNVQVITVTVKLKPRLTSDIYIIERTIDLDAKDVPKLDLASSGG